jgi:hypothetical protein
MSAVLVVLPRGLTSGLLAGAMTDGLTCSPAELIALWRSTMTAQGLTHREVDFRAGWGEGYCSKLLCGDREPTATTISRMNQALGIRLVKVDGARETVTP